MINVFIGQVDAIGNEKSSQKPNNTNSPMENICVVPS
jgi:hypothetical protein